MRRSSIAWRLAIGLSLMTAILWLGAAAISGYVVYRELGQAFDQSLEQSAFRLLPLAVHRLREPEEHDEELRVGGEDSEDAFFSYAVLRANGAVVVRGNDVPDEILAAAFVEGFSDIDGRRAFALTDRRSSFRIVVFERTEHRAEALAESIGGLLWPLAALLPLIAAGIWYAVRLAMRPVERLRRDVASRDRSNLAPIDTTDQPVELAPIAEAIGELIERLRAALDAERAFAASSAHELRTPIAGALAQVQRLAIELGDGRDTARLREIETALRHLSQLSEKLLQRARLEAGFARSARSHDLLPVLRLVVRDVQSLSLNAGRVELMVPPEASLAGHIDPDAFAIAVRNLIDNALLHGEADGPVEVRVEPGNGLAVANDGRPVPPETLARLAQPFARGDTTARGTGLGLSIVQTIMDQTGGKLELFSPAPGSTAGFLAVLRLA